MIEYFFFHPCSLDIKIRLNIKHFALNIFLLFIMLAVVEYITGNSYSFKFFAYGIPFLHIYILDKSVVI
jgi:hypothetical protein